MNYVIFFILKYCFIGIWIVVDIDILLMERFIIWGVLELEDKYNVEVVEFFYRKVVLNVIYIFL